MGPQAEPPQPQLVSMSLALSMGWGSLQALVTDALESQCRNGEKAFLGSSCETPLLQQGAVRVAGEPTSFLLLG